MGDLCVDAKIILKRILRNNVKTDFKETGCEREEWIPLAYDRNQLRDIVRGNESSGCIKAGVFHQLTDSQHLN
jgi:hypothetical protein